MHFVVGGWYLDCSRGMFRRREPLNNNLVCFAPEVIELEEEPEEDENPAPTTNQAPKSSFSQQHFSFLLALEEEGRSLGYKCYIFRGT